MKRRDFLKAAAPATLLPFFMGGYSVKAFAKNPFLNAMIQSGVSSDRILVLVQLIGGNDGLNTVIPLDQYSEIMAARGDVAVLESERIKITDTIGFHPNFTGMQTLFNQGKLAVVQGVGYPQPNYSHFRSTDIWLTGADYNQILPTGWMGRYLDQEYPGYPSGFPNAQNPDPVAVQIGSAVSLAFEGQNSNLGMAFSDPAAFYDIVGGNTASTASTRAGHELAYVRSIGLQLQNFSAPVKNAAGKGKTLSAQWPAANTNSLADQLRIVSQLISGGLKTKIYVVSLGGFDSHYNLRTNQDPLLGMVSEAISAFQDELKLQQLEDRVLGMTFSEFGRRVKSNASAGTDHGAAAPMFLFGTQVVAGIHGDNPKLPAAATVDDNVDMQYDFRSIYASVLKEWFGASDAETMTTLLKDYPTLNIIQQQSSVVPASSSVRATILMQNYPNPCTTSTNIAFRTSGGPTLLRVFDMQGNLIETALNENIVAGEKTITFDTRSLASGTYAYRLETGGMSAVREMVVLH